MSEELKPCPFCNGEAQRTESSGLVSCASEECPAFLLAVPADSWNRRTQPAEAEGVDFGFGDRSVKVSQEAYSIFLARERHHLAALSAVTAERDRLRGTAEDLGLALQDAEERAESAGRNASAFEDRMGDLQVENGRLQDRIRPLMAFTQQMARQEGEPYFQRLARAAMAAKEA